MVERTAADKVSDFEDFVRMAAIALRQIAQVVVVHADQIVVGGKIAVFQAAADKTAVRNAHFAEDVVGALVHEFAVMPAGGAGTGAGYSEAALCSGMAEQVFGHRRSADVAQADEQDALHGFRLPFGFWVRCG